MQESFDELRFLHLELGLEPLNSFSVSRLLPAESSEETGRHHALALHRFISMCSPEEDQSDATVLAEQPSVGLMAWARETVSLVSFLAIRGCCGQGLTSPPLQWQAEKRAREEQIQALYDQVEPIWHRLGFDQDDINAFVEEHCGLDREVLQAVRSCQLLQVMCGRGTHRFAFIVRRRTLQSEDVATRKAGILHRCCKNRDHRFMADPSLWSQYMSLL